MSRKLLPAPISRREALLAAGVALVPVGSVAQEGRNQSPLPAAEQAEIDTKFANVIRKFGDRLTSDQRTRVREVLVRHQRMLMRVRAFPLDNSNSPATGLRLFP